MRGTTVMALPTVRTFAIATSISCAGCDDSSEAGSGPNEVRGRLVDAETGKPVSRRTIWTHAFNDATKKQASLEPGDGTTFRMRLPLPEIRLRIADKENEYSLFEKNFTVPEDGKLDLEVRLEPTHWIRLHGHVYERDGDEVRTIVHDDGSLGCRPQVSIGLQSLSYDDDGAYSVRVPRERVRLMAVDTNRSPTPAELDLRGVTDADRVVDIYLEIRPRSSKTDPER